MASAKCAREECGKTVYPMEELKCLDKVWHKGCFKCTTCGMTLSMKTYKGYEKKPYCEAHYPKTVPTAVMETPDMERVKTNTALQSQVKYHEAYEKMKGTKIEVADDPEMKRLLDNTKHQSLAHYHGEQKKKEAQDQHREGGAGAAAAQAFAVYNSPSLDSLGSAHSQASSVRNSGPSGGANGNGYGQANQQQPEQYNGHAPQHAQPQQPPSYAAYAASLADKDASPYSQRIAQQARGTTIYSSEMGGRVSPAGGEKQVGSIADYDPMGAEKQQSAVANQQAAAAAKAPAGKAATGGFTVKALYDYTAADKDEVSFKEGDAIVNCQKVDEGWMTGTVQRTLLWGMLPANYVEKVNTPVGQFRMKTPKQNL